VELLINMTIDLSGSGNTAEWATVVIAFLAFLAASSFAYQQIAIMKTQQIIVENQEKRQKKANLVANFRKIPLQHPTAPGIEALPLSGISYDPTFEVEIRNIGPANARGVRATIMGIYPNNKKVEPSSPDVPDIIAGDRFTHGMRNTELWERVVIVMEWEDDSGEERKTYKELKMTDIGKSFSGGL